MKLNCADCQAPIKSTDMNLERMLATCASCHSIFSFADRFPTASSLRMAGAERPEVPRPSSVQVVGTGKGLSLTSSWFNLGLIPLVFFCIAWDSFLINWYAMALTGKGPWIMVVFPIVHVAVGVGLTYSCIAGFLNTTRIDIQRDSLTVSHGPVPWRGNRVIPALSLDQLYCKEKISNNRNGVRHTYSVMAVTKNGETLELLSGIEEQEKALFIEQQVERHLGITDRPMPGELAR